jgi:hypothetical protein
LASKLKSILPGTAAAPVETVSEVVAVGFETAVVSVEVGPINSFKSINELVIAN